MHIIFALPILVGSVIAIIFANVLLVVLERGEFLLSYNVVFFIFQSGSVIGLYNAALHKISRCSNLSYQFTNKMTLRLVFFLILKIISVIVMVYLKYGNKNTDGTASAIIINGSVSYTNLVCKLISCCLTKYYTSGDGNGYWDEFIRYILHFIFGISTLRYEFCVAFWRNYPLFISYTSTCGGTKRLCCLA